MLRAESKSDAVRTSKCGACGFEAGDPNDNAGGAGCWGVRLCYPCLNDWQKGAPSYGDLEREGITDTVRAFKAYTQRWLGDKRGRAG